MENIFRHYFLLNEIPVYLVNSNLKKEQLTILSSYKFNAFEFCCGNSQISSNYFDVTNEETKEIIIIMKQGKEIQTSRVYKCKYIYKQTNTYIYDLKSCVMKMRCNIMFYSY